MKKSTIYFIYLCFIIALTLLGLFTVNNTNRGFFTMFFMLSTYPLFSFLYIYYWFKSSRYLKKNHSVFYSKNQGISRWGNLRMIAWYSMKKDEINTIDDPYAQKLIGNLKASLRYGAISFFLTIPFGIATLLMVE